MPDYYNNRSNYRPNHGGPADGGNRRNYTVTNTTPLELPDDYVDQAERVMQQLVQNRVQLTTSKLRNILSRISNIYNAEVDRTDDELLPESENSLQMVRIRIAYECGRENAVKQFVEEAKLLRYIKSVKSSRIKFIHFARYMEALVAYHRFFGGKD